MSRAKTTRNTGKIFTSFLEKLRISGMMERCFVFCRGLSSTRIIDGSTVTQPSTPSSTPLAMTMPKSRPSVKLMKHRAMKPEMVVTELPMTLVRVAWMAVAMASSLLSQSGSCSL